MISTNQLKIHIYQIFNLLAKTGSTLEVSYRGKPYELFLRPSNAKVRMKYSPRPNQRKKALNPHTMTYESCKACGDLKVSGICLNPKCSQGAPTSLTNSP